VLERLGDDPTLDDTANHYPLGVVLFAINVAQRLFVLNTLCLETTAAFTLAGDGRPTYKILAQYADYVLPLRVAVSGGGKVKPSSIAELAALTRTWASTSGTPIRYAVTGFDLLSIFRQPTSTTALDFTYARGPARITAAADVPEIPASYHSNLADAAIVLCRLIEGAQELQEVLPLWQRYKDSIAQCADQVRARNQAQGYDHAPSEIKRYDLTNMVRIMKAATRKAAQTNGG
jgi:hypothetical protein